MNMSLLPVQKFFHACNLCWVGTTAYALLGLHSFFTVGEDECRAWTIKNGMSAQEAAGVIHSDFFAKFIHAEVVHYDHFITAGGSFTKTKESGQWRLEGKEYIVKNGNIISIRHSSFNASFNNGHL
jgi:ribosome-binding ATPase YchF (GTP1/OBG family)